MKRLNPQEAREARREFEKSRRAPGAVSAAARRIRREKAIEKSLTPYLPLECGHYGTHDAVFKPRDGAFWCDVEGVFSPQIQRIVRSRDIPEEAPF